MRMNLMRALCVCLPAAVVLTVGAINACAQEHAAQQNPPESYQTFYLTNSTGVHDANDIQTALRNMLPNARLYYSQSGNAISVRGSAEDLAMAQKILADLDRPRKTYRVTYTLTDGGNGQSAPQHFVLVVTPGSKAMLKQGSRVPIMTGSYGTGSDQSNSQFQYQDVGINIEASLEGYGDGMRLRTKIEETSVAEEKSNVGIQDPLLRQSVLDSESTVAAGKPIVLGSVETSGRHFEVSAMVEAVK
jgi:type II secretory pathway component GspD/PulD (secretin)